MSADRIREGFTGDSEGIECGEEEVARSSSPEPVNRGRLLANVVKMASRAARKLADNFDEKKVLSSDCTIFFARLGRDIDAYIRPAQPPSQQRGYNSAKSIRSCCVARSVPINVCTTDAW